MERRWGEGGSRDIVEGSEDKGIFAEEAGGNLGSESGRWSWDGRWVELFQFDEAHKVGRLSAYPDQGRKGALRLSPANVIH